MEKEVYKVNIVTTLFRKGKPIIEEGGDHYIVVTEKQIEDLHNNIDNVYKTFEDAYEAVQESDVIDDAFVATESLFGKQRITHYDICHQPLHTTKKQFDILGVKVVTQMYKGTIKDYASKLSADDFIEYCLEKVFK